MDRKSNRNILLALEKARDSDSRIFIQLSVSRHQNIFLSLKKQQGMQSTERSDSYLSSDSRIFSFVYKTARDPESRKRSDSYLLSEFRKFFFL